MVADAMFAGGQCSCVYDNEAQTQEIAVQVSGGGAENQLSGVLVNRIPRTGGNKFGGEFVTNFANTSLSSQNSTPTSSARGLTVPAKLYRQYDINYTVDGPIVKDRLWFFFSGRNWAYNNYVGGAVNPDGTQAIDDNTSQGVSGAHHRPADAEEQGDGDVRLVGQGSRPRQPLGDDRARRQPEAEPAGPAHRAGEMDVDADQSPAARGRLQPDLQQRASISTNPRWSSAPATPPSRCARRARATAASRTRT